MPENNTTASGYISRNGQVVIRNTAYPAQTKTNPFTSLAARIAGTSMAQMARTSICDSARPARVARPACRSYQRSQNDQQYRGAEALELLQHPPR